jgi:hypothetical protein
MPFTLDTIISFIMSYNAQIETARAILNSVSSQLFSILLIPVVFLSVWF